MSGVVLRCPNCGTTRSAPGECDACHEAEVRYYCGNHSPGRWLDGATCLQCGARFGAPAPAPRRPPPPPASPPRPAPRTPPAPATRSPAPSWRAPAESPPPPPSRAPRWTRLPPVPPGDEHPGRGPTLDDILREAARPRRVPREAPPAPDIGPAVRGLGGCLVRAVLLVFFLILALVAGLFVFGGALLQMFGSPY